jgi:sec-independent protein translocase protein TatB
MLGIGLPELFTLALLGLLVFGPERLPEMSRKAAIGTKALRRQFQKAMSDLNVEQHQVQKALGELQSLTPRALITDVVGGVARPTTQPARAAAVEAVFDPDAT